MSILITQNPEKFVKYENKPEVNRLLFKNINYGNSDDVKEIAYGAYPSVSVSEPSAFASFNDGADNIPVENITVHIKPVQDLHGQENPWPAGGGVNKLAPSASGTETDNDITVVSDGNGKYTISGTADGSANITFILAQPYTIQNGDYLHMLNSEASGSAVITLLNETTAITAPSMTPINRIFDLSAAAGSTITAIKFYIASGTAYTGTVQPMICQSSSATSYAPYSNICPISGWTGANVVRTGFNQWDEVAELGSINNNGQNIETTNTIRSKNYVSVIPGSTYYYKSTETAGLRFYDANKVFVSSLTRTANGTFVIPENVHYLRFVVLSGYGTTYNHDICINLSDPAKNGTYEPYHGNTYSIDWTTEAGTVYGGTLDVTSGVLTVDRAIVDLGTLAWGYNKNNQGTYVFNTTSIQSLVNSGLCICSAYKTNTNTARPASMLDKTLSINKSPLVISGNFNSGEIIIKDSAYDGYTGAQFKEAMSGVMLVYKLATPQTYQLTPQEVSTLLGQNNIWADCGNVSVEYRADTTLYIKNILNPTGTAYATENIESGKYFIANNKLYISTAIIAQGDAIMPGTNCTETNVAEALNLLNS